MRKILSIIHYEYKMQIERLAAWGVVLFGTFVTLLDNFPSDRNLARLEFLIQPAYFLYRIIMFDVLIVAFGLMVLLSNRFLVDIKNGVKYLIVSSPVTKGQYIAGKLMAALLYTFTMLFVFVTANWVVYCVATPFKISVAECVALLLKTTLVSIIPISVFVSFCSTVLPELIDIRLFYILAAILFVFNVFYVGTAGEAPFYMITSGSLCYMIWQHPELMQVEMRSVYANLMFLLGCSIIFLMLLLFNRKFWREE